MEFLERDDDKSLSLVTGIGTGKTTIAAIWLIMQAMKGQDSIVSAQNYGALNKVIFKEIRTQSDRFGIAHDYNKTDKMITFGNGSVIYGASSDSPTGLVGVSNVSNLLMDEAALTDKELYYYLSERCRGKDHNGNKIRARYRFTTTPSNLAVADWFTARMKAHPEEIIHATTYDNTFLEEGWADEQVAKYGGPEAPMARQQIFGELLEADIANVIIRNSEFPKTPTLAPGDVFMGGDMSGAGRDGTVFVARNGREILDIRKNADGKVESDNRLFIEMFNKYKPKAWAVDGTGGFARGLELIAPAYPGGHFINFGAGSEDEMMANMRAELYMGLRTAVLGGFFIDRERWEAIDKQIRYTTYYLNQSGRMQITRKDDIRKMLGGASPDETDALCLSFMAEKMMKDGVDGTHDEDYYRNLVSRIR